MANQKKRTDLAKEKKQATATVEPAQTTAPHSNSAAQPAPNAVPNDPPSWLRSFEAAQTATLGPVQSSGPTPALHSKPQGPPAPGPVRAPSQTSQTPSKEWWEKNEELNQAEARKAKVDTKQMKAAATELHRALSGWGTDEDAVLNTLRGKSSAEVAAIKNEYKKHYDADLDSLINDELSGDDLKEAQSHMKGDKVAGVLAGLENSVGFWNDDESKIEDLMRGLDPKELARLKAHPEWKGMSAKMKDHLGGDDHEVFNALETGDKGKASAVRLDEAMGSSRSWYNPSSWGTDEEGVYKNLENLPPEQRKLAEAAFDQRMKDRGENRTLRSEMGNELSNADEARAAATLDNDTATLAAAKIEQTMQDFGTDEKTLFGELEGLPETERLAVLAAYEKKFGTPLLQRLEGEMSGVDKERARMAAEGKQDDTFKLFFGMNGVGTDEQLLRDTLKGKSKQDIQNMRTNWDSTYAKRYGSDFDTAFSQELSGRDHFDLVEIGMRGEPKTAEEKRQVMEMQYDYERGSRSTWVGRNMMDLADDVGFSDSARVLDMQNERLQSAIGADGKIKAPDSAIDDLYGYSQDDLEDYRAAKDSVTDAVATGANLTAATIATILTAGSASPWLAAALSSALGGVVGMGVKAAMQGEAYGIEDIGVDALANTLAAGLAGAGESAKLISSLDELSSKFGPKFAALVAEQTGNPLARSMYIGTGEGMLMGTGNGLINGVMNEDALRSGPGDYLAGIGQSSGAGFLRGGLSGVTSSVSSHYAGAAFKENTLGSNLAKNISQNAVTETALTAMDANTYQGRAEDVFGRFGKSAMSGTVQGFAEGVRDHTITQRALRAAAEARKTTPGPESMLNPEVQAALDPNQPIEALHPVAERTHLSPEERLTHAQTWAEQAFDSGAMGDSMAEFIINNFDDVAKLEEVLGTHELKMGVQGGKTLPNPDDAGLLRFHREVLGATPFVQGEGDAHALDPSDVKQGALGDCWLMASMQAATIADPEQIRKLIEDRGDGTYGVTLHEHEQGETALNTREMDMDGKFAHDLGIFRSYAGNGDKANGQTEIWPSLLEKGAAIMRNGYDGIGEGDHINRGIEMVTGMPTFDQYIGGNDGMGLEIAMAQIQYALDQGLPVSVASRYMEKDPKLAKSAAKAGVVGNHAYAPSSTGGVGADISLLNPWGKKHVDGMSQEDFGKYFSTYAIGGNATPEIWGQLRAVQSKAEVDYFTRNLSEPKQ